MYIASHMVASYIGDRRDGKYPTKLADYRGHASADVIYVADSNGKQREAL